MRGGEHMATKQYHCGENKVHDFHEIGKPEEGIIGFDPVLRIPVECSKCELQAFKSYSYAAIVTKDNIRV
jgi:hypothetical protein